MISVVVYTVRYREMFLMDAPKTRLPPSGPVVDKRFDITFDLEWGSKNIGASYPPSPHTGNILVIVHSYDFDPKDVLYPNSYASQGVAMSAEYGVVDKLMDELEHTYKDSIRQMFILPSMNAPQKISFSVVTNTRHPLVTLTTMLAPSQDFYTSVTTYLPFNDKSGVSYAYPFDAGTQRNPSFIFEPKDPVLTYERIKPVMDGAMYPMGISKPEPIGMLISKVH